MSGPQVNQLKGVEDPTERVGSDPEVREKPERRRFTADYKLRIVREAEQSTESGEIGALLRREGLYSSQLGRWRKQYKEGALGALDVKKRGRRAVPPNPLSGEVQRLSRENRRLEKKLRKAEAIIEFQKKIAEILEIPLGSPESEENE